jgi:glycosyltransferase involved in cell wall biosynthesis
MDSRDPNRPFPVPSPGPLVSLGLPVYNGSNYLAEALDSILAQTYPNWELILSDNGSTDSTPALCAAYAARDGRIRYHRHAVNMGASRNFNFTFALARGPYFRWTAHDDVCAPQLLERCLAGLLAHPEAVLCHPRTRVIGPAGEFLYDDAVRLRTESRRPAERWNDLIALDHACFAVFGLMRTSLLRRTRLLEAFVGSDRNLLAELSLLGPFHEIPEYLFHRRDHPGTSTRRFPQASARLAWFRESPSGAWSPTLRRAAGYLASLWRVPLAARDRLACLGALLRWCGSRMASARPFRKSYTSGEGTHGFRHHPLSLLPGRLPSGHEGLPLLRGGARPPAL